MNDGTTRSRPSPSTSDLSALLSPVTSAALSEVLAPLPPWSQLPRTVRRSIAYLALHLDGSVDSERLAAQSATSLRALQYAFRRHLDVTPMAFYRRLRLACAHRELSDSHPGDGVTVGAVAARYGFYNAGRFAAEYSDIYDLRPGESLRRITGTTASAAPTHATT